jgi:hypothetical protein
MVRTNDKLRHRIQEVAKERPLVEIRPADQDQLRRLPLPRRSPYEIAPSSLATSKASRLDRAGTVALIAAVSSILVAVISGVFLLASKESPAPPPPVVVTNCPEQQQGAIDRVKENPGLVPRYSGPSDEQCHLNDLVNQKVQQQGAHGSSFSGSGGGY